MCCFPLRPIVWAIALIVSIFTAQGNEPTPPKPVLLLGSDYGKYERGAWLKEILVPNGILFENSEKWVPPSEWGQYSAVIICSTAPSQLDDAGAEQADEYVKSGGTLILLENALATLFKGNGNRSSLPSWTGATSIASIQNADVYDVKTRETAFADTQLPSSGLGKNFVSFVPKTGAQVILGVGGKAILAVTPRGKGRVVFWGGLIFRMLNTESTGEREKTISARTASLSRTEDPGTRSRIEAGIAALKAANERAAESGISKTKELIGSFAKGLLAIHPLLSTATADQLKPLGKELIVWKRDPIAIEALFHFEDHVSGPVFSPPFPSQKEVVNELRADLGRGEIYQTFLNVTPAKVLAKLSVSLDMSSPGAGRAPTVEILRQESLEPGSNERSQEEFWLSPCTEWMPQVGNTSIFWLKVNSENADAGEYRGSIRFKGKDCDMSFPIIVHIWPVDFDRGAALRLGFYGFNWLSPFPRFVDEVRTVKKKVSVDFGQLKPVLQNQYDLGGGALVDGTFSLQGIKIKSTGKELQELIKDGLKVQSFLDEKGNVPELDFSAMDDKIDMARSIGFDRVNIRHGYAVFVQPASNYVTLLTGEPLLSEKWSATFVEIWRQYIKYLSAKGFVQFTFKIGDELSKEDTLNQWLPIARLVKKAGWIPEMNLTAGQYLGPGVSEVINRVSSNCGSYSINVNYVDEFLQWEKDGVVKPPENTLLSEYGSWGYYKSPASYTRSAIWGAWFKGLSGVDVYTYAAIALFDGKQVYNSASAAGIQAGWDDTTYLALLRAQINSSAAVPDADWRQRAQRFLDGVVSPQSSYGLLWDDILRPNFKYPVKEIRGNSAGFDSARRDLLQLLSEGENR